MRFPYISELYSNGLHRGAAAIERGIMMRDGFERDPSFIHKEVSTKFTQGFQLIRKNFSLELSAHINHISNYVYLKPSGTELTIRGYFPVFEYHQTNALLTGIDGLVHADISKHVEYTGTFAYLYAKDITRNDVLIFIPPAQMEHTFMYTTTTAREQEIFFAVSVPVGFKQNRAPATVYPSDITPDMGEQNFDFAPAPDAYVLVNSSMGIKLPLKERELSISLEGQNLLNTSYRTYMNRLRYFADEPGRNFVLRLKYNFHSHE
jgi:iron complex outermembrane recepter protein